VQKIVPDEFEAVLLKGRQNYLCTTRLARALTQSKELFTTPQHAELERIREWSMQTKDGSLSDFLEQPDPAVWEEVRSEQHLCTPKSCGPGSGCFYQNLRRRVANAKMVVLNHALFFTLLNGMKRHESLDFANRAALAARVADADIIIEGSRPRALAQLGLDARREVARGVIWISITGHDRGGADAMRVGFGDDAAVAGGLASAMADGWGEPMFAGDAISDPLTGIHAALAGWQAWQAGRGALLALSLRRTVAFAARAGRVRGATLAAWQAAADADTAPLYPLRVPPC
jgi:hypothetical protein